MKETILGRSLRPNTLRTTFVAVMATAALAGCTSQSRAPQSALAPSTATAESASSALRNVELVQVPAGIKMNRNAEKAFDILRRNKHMSSKVAATLVGEMYVESRVEPAQEGINGSGRGLLQWSTAGSWQRVEDFATKQHTSPNDLTTQIDFLDQDLRSQKNLPVLEAMESGKSVASAVDIFDKGYLRLPSEVSYQSRRLAGEAALQAFDSNS